MIKIRPGRKIAAGLLALVVTTAGLAACSSSSKTPTASGSSSTTAAAGTGAAPASSAAPSSGSGKSYTIAFIDPIAAQPILTAYAKALAAAGSRVNVKVIHLDTNLSASAEVAHLNQVIAQHVDLIVAFLISPKSDLPILQRAKDAGIKLIAFSQFPTKQDSSASIAPYDADLEEGETYIGAPLLGKVVQDKLNGKGNVIGLVACTGSSLLTTIQNAEKAAILDGQPGIHWLGSICDKTFDQAGAQAAMATALVKYHNDIQAVVCDADNTCFGAGQAFKNAGIKTYVSAAQNGDPTAVAAVKSGLETATINIQPVIMAQVTMDEAVALLNGQSVPKRTDLPVQLITQDNVSDYVPWDTQIAQLQAGTLATPTGLATD